MLEKIKNFIKDTRVEMFKVTWPTREMIIRDSILVIIASLGVAAFLGLLDTVFQYLLNTFVL